MVTYEGLFVFTTLIVGIVGLCYTIFGKKK